MNDTPDRLRMLAQALRRMGKDEITTAEMMARLEYVSRQCPLGATERGRAAWVQYRTYTTTN